MNNNNFTSSIYSFFQDALPIILAIFFLVFFGIIILRIILNIVLDISYKNFQKIKNKTKKIFPRNKKFIKEEDEKIKKRLSEIPKAHSFIKSELQKNKNNSLNNSYEIISSEQQTLDKEEMNKIEIVDIVKPIGFWTSMILGQKLTYLIQSAQMLNKRGDKGFWASMIEAKERAAGRQHGRGR
jgi:hypothetical protein